MKKITFVEAKAAWEEIKKKICISFLPENIQNLDKFFYDKKTERGNERMRETIADLCHRQWSGWMEYLFSKCVINEDGTATIPSWAVERWKRQIKTDYINLSETEKNSDRKEADRFIQKFEARK